MPYTDLPNGCKFTYPYINPGNWKSPKASITKRWFIKHSYKDQPGFRLLYENFVMSLGHIFEDAYCYNKLTKEAMGIWRFKYDPTCGIISKNNDWSLVGGEILILKTFFYRTVRPVGDLQDIHEIKLVGDNAAQFLTDP